MKRKISLFGLLQGLVAIILLVFVFVSGKAKFQADILALLPQDSHALAQNAEAHFFNKNKTQIFISFAGETANIAHDKFLSLVQQKPWFNKTNENIELDALIDFYIPYRGQLISPQYSEAIKNPQSFNTYANQKLSEVVNPFISQSIAGDPSLSIADYVGYTLSKNNYLIERDGRLVTNSVGIDANEERTFILFNVRQDDLSIDNSVLLAREIKQIIEQVQGELSSVDIRYSGNLFHTAENSSQAKFEMSFFGGLSLFAMLILVYFVFRDKQALFAVSLTILNATVYGFIALVYVFEKVHIISLVFGVTLIGIAIDYCFHVLTDLTNEKGRSSTVKKSIVLGFVTTALGYTLLNLAPMNVFSQVATFVVAGLAGAMVCVFTLVPMLSFSATRNKSIDKLIERLIFLMNWFNGYRIKVFASLSVLIVLSYVYLPISFNDSIADLNGSSQKLIENEKLHQKALAQQNVVRAFLFSENLEPLLQKEELLRQTILEINTKAKVYGVTDWLPSQKKQLANRKLVERAKAQNIFTSWREATGLDVNFGNQKLLSLDNIRDSVISKNVSLFLFHDEATQKYVALLQISGVSKSYINKLFKEHEIEALLFDKAENISEVMKQSRESLISWFVFAFMIFAAVICFKFGVNIALNQSFVLVLSVCIALVLSYIIQGPLNLFNILAMMLILALAIDYLIFYQYRGMVSTNVLAITLSALSSLFVFGMLVFSNTPAVYSFGLTVMLGIASIFFLAPLSISKKEIQ